MSQGKSKNLKSEYRLIAKCRNCGSHIFIGIDLNIEETPEYGRKKNVKYDILPPYIKNALRSAQNNINSITIPTTESSSTSTTRQPICCDCWRIAKLKE